MSWALIERNPDVQAGIVLADTLFSDLLVTIAGAVGHFSL